MKKITLNGTEYTGDKLIKTNDTITLYNEDYIVISLQGYKDNEYTIEGDLDKTQDELIQEQFQTLGQQITELMLGGV